MLALTLLSLPCAYAHDGKPDDDGSVEPPAGYTTPVDLSARPLRAGESSCLLEVRLLDGDSDSTVAGVVRAYTTTGQRVRLPGLLPRATGLSPHSYGALGFPHIDSWSALPGEATVAVPQVELWIEAIRGPNSIRVRKQIDLRDRDSASIKLSIKALVPLKEKDWYAGNTHLHLQKMDMEEAERYSCETAAADAYDIVFFSYLERAEADQFYISNYFTDDDLARFSKKSGVLFGYGEEYRHNLMDLHEGYGHVMFLDLEKLILPASFGESITRKGNDDGSLRGGIQQARDQDATVLWCHGSRGMEDIPSWLAGLIDVQMIFDQGSLGTYENALYRYLNVGLRVPIATGTDWFLCDMATVYAQCDGPLTREKWLAGLRAGRSFITNGPILSFSVNGLGPGETIDTTAGTTIQISGDGIGSDDFGQLELICNGETIAVAGTENTSRGYKAHLSFDTTANTSGWYALRVRPFDTTYDKPETGTIGFNAYGRPLFAHTSAVYVTVEGQRVYQPDAAKSLLVETQQDRQTIKARANFSSTKKRDETLSLYEVAAETLRRMERVTPGASK